MNPYKTVQGCRLGSYYQSVNIWLTSAKVFKVNELAASVANAKSQVMCPEIQVMSNIGDYNCKKVIRLLTFTLR